MLTINSKFLNAIVKQEVQLYKNGEDYKDLLNRSFGQGEKDTIRILSVYDKIQKKLLDLEIERLKKNNSFDELVSLLYEKSRDIQFLEKELFKLLKSDDKENHIMDSFYGMISNENIELFELIEHEFEGSKQK